MTYKIHCMHYFKETRKSSVHFQSTIRWLTSNTKQFIIALLCLLNVACNDPNELPELSEGDDTEIGFVTVALDVSALNVRSGEALIGNIITDSMAQAATDEGFSIDLAVTNGGAIRFDPIEFPDAVFPAGPVTRADLLNFLPFDNSLAIITITGAQLKQVFERSVAGLPGLPSPPGQFLQVSQNVSLFIDLLKQPQIIDQNQEPAVIITAGERISEIMIAGEPINPRATYTLVTNSFLAAGGDGYTVFESLPGDQITVLPTLDREAVETYLINNSPLSPTLSNRISIVD